MRDKFQFCFVRFLSFCSAVLIPLVFTSPVSAEFIQLVTGASIVVNQDEKTFTLKLSLKNKGDEPGRDVDIELPELSETRSIAPSIIPGKPLSFEDTFSFDVLGIKGPGVYPFPFRILYRDDNSFPFSAAQVVFVKIAPLPSRVVSASVEGKVGMSDIELDGKRSFEVLIKNVSDGAITLEKAFFFTSVEVVSVPSSSPVFPLQLEPHGQIRIPVALENIGALPGSSYGSQFVVTGKIADRQFAEATSVLVKIAQESNSQRTVIIAGLVALLLFVLLVAYLRRGK